MTVSARKRIWGWWFFDWASQPYNTLLLTFSFGPYFAEVARAHFVALGQSTELSQASAQAYWTGAQTVTGLIIAILAPVLGVVADGRGRKMPWIWAFSAMYVVGAYVLWWTRPEMPTLFWSAFWFSFGFIGMELATNFTNALMPSLAGHDEMGKVSGTGFAFGYLGGVIALFIFLLFFAEDAKTGKTLIGLSPAFGLDPATREGTRSVGPFTAIWYVVFMVPFFLWVREPAIRGGEKLGQSFAKLGTALRALKARPSLLYFLIASMFYRDALNATYALGGAFASNVMGWSVIQSGTFGIIAAIAATIASWAGGKLDSSIGPKPVIVLAVAVLAATIVVMMNLTPTSFFGTALAEGSSLPDTVFYGCGVVIGAAGGVAQAASRTLMVYHTTEHDAAGDFGFYGLSGKATAFLAPAMITVATTALGSARLGIAPLIVLFLIGLVLLLRVNPQGERGGA
ncbi:MAG: MFS transporter [Defluviimonas sp.]|uniref:MFS transporter n=1 Tax=Albidovulum sp. TaxID=1872424 RepID=UPI001E1A3CB2|nr:MFS transporter [Paracoccaceae bacterium]MCC0063326.1 MFS transporter [Defluviimonas sp.]